MSRAPGIRTPLQGTQEPITGGRVPTPRVAVVGSETDTAAAVRSLIASGAGLVGTVRQEQRDRYDKLVEEETEKAVTAALEGTELPELRTDEAQEAYQRAQGAMLAMELDPGAVEMREGQSFGESVRDYFDQEMAGLPTATRVQAFQDFLPRFVRHARAAREANNEQLLDNEASGLTARLANPDAPPEELTRDYHAFVRRAQAMGKTDEQIIAATLVPAGRAAAENGDVDRASYLDGLAEGRLPDRFSQIRGAAEATRSQQRLDEHLEAVRTVEDPIRGMGPVIEAIETDDALGERAKQQALSRAYGAQNAAVQQHRGRVEESLIQRGRLGGDPQQIMAEVGARYALPINDPEHLDYRATDRVLGVLEEAVAQDGRSEQVTARLTGEATAPLTSDHDDALVEALAASGAISVTRTGDDRYAFENMRDPVAWAATVKAAGRNPKEITDAITTGLASADAGEVGTSLELYATLHATAPQMAEKMLDGMSDTAKLRVGYLMSKPRPAARDREAFQATIETHLPAAMRLEPVTLEDQQARGILWYGNNPGAFADESRTFAVASDDLKENVPDDLRSRVFGQDIEDLPAHVVNTYRQIAADQLRMNIGLGMSQTQAAEKAKADAARLTFLDHPPVDWGGETIFPPSGTNLPAGDWDWGAMIEADLSDPRMGLDDEELAAAVDSHRPVWHPSRRAWRLVNAHGQPLIADNGQIFESDPFGVPAGGKQEALREDMHQFRLNIEQQGREAYTPRQRRDATFNAQRMQTLRQGLPYNASGTAPWGPAPWDRPPVASDTPGDQ